MPRNPGTGIYTKPYPDVISDTTIESTVHNGEIADIETDLNTPRPIVAGGTGANNATQARANLSTEVRGVQVTNYDTQVWESGSFFSNAGATAAPGPDAFQGICYHGGNADFITLEARNGLNASLFYLRQKVGGVWSAWEQQGGSLLELDGRYVNVTGDTMTGALTVSVDTAAIALNGINLGAGASRLAFSNAALNRWIIQADHASGGNLAIFGFDNAGTLANTPLTVDRATGLATVQGSPTAANGIATKSYVDTTTVSMTGDTMTGPLYATIVGATPNGYPQLTDAISARYLNWTATSYHVFTIATGETGLYNNSTGMQYYSRAGDKGFFVGGQAYKPAGGAWADSSDARIKNVLGNYENGLDAVLQLQPVRYTFKGNDTPAQVMPSGDPVLQFDADGKLKQGKVAVVPYANSPHGIGVAGTEYIGLIAQAVEGYMPEMVTQHAATIDGQPVSDLRVLDTTPLLYALVNSIKTLVARIEVLEAAQAPT